MGKRKGRIVMVTNDDGVQSPGIIALAEAVSDFARAVIVGPEGPQSAAGMSLTFHKPLRVNSVMVGKWTCYAISGSPADSIMVGINKILPSRPDLVVSGINLGDNVTIQDIFASGTIAAALEASVMGIPSIAFSMEITDKEALSGVGVERFSEAAKVAGRIAREVLVHGLPKGVDLLNVNFPSAVNPETPIRITTLERRKYKDYVIERKDPRGRPYFWLWGARLPEFDKNSDVFALQKEKAISVTPLRLDFTPAPSAAVERFGRRLSRTNPIMHK
jgi:5'/3'-nucleotidase